MSHTKFKIFRALMFERAIWREKLLKNILLNVLALVHVAIWL